MAVKERTAMEAASVKQGWCTRRKHIKRRYWTRRRERHGKRKVVEAEALNVVDVKTVNPVGILLVDVREGVSI